MFIVIVSNDQSEFFGRLFNFANRVGQNVRCSETAQAGLDDRVVLVVSDGNLDRA